MSVSPRHYDPNLNLVGRPNVLVSPDSPPTQTNHSLYLAINNLVLTRPQWRFFLTDCYVASTERVATGVKITEDGEALGEVSIEYKGKDHKLRIENDRINSKRERGRGYHTDDPAKAELRIRKTFFRLGKDERLSKARTAAYDVLAREFSGKQYAADRSHSQVYAESDKFAANNLSLYLEQFPARVTFKKKYEAQLLEFQTVRNIQESFDKGRGVLVVLDGTQYLTQTGDTIQNYTDDTLPYDMRMKLGMLKLVEDKQMISDVGCRVDKFTYVVTAEKIEKEQA